MTIIVSDKYPRDKVISIVEAAILFLKAIILACFASQKWNFTALIKRSWHGPRSDLSRMSEVATYPLCWKTFHHDKYKWRNLYLLSKIF